MGTRELSRASGLPRETTLEFESSGSLVHFTLGGKVGAGCVQAINPVAEKIDGLAEPDIS